MKLRSTLALALALASARTRKRFTSRQRQWPWLLELRGRPALEAWPVPRPGPQGYSHPATTVYSEKCAVATTIP
ncbi:MAG: hypothetical protein U0836_26310 [Pirellulales bacterium]